MDYIIMENGEKILLETQQKVTIQRTVDIYKQYRKGLLPCFSKAKPL